MNCTCLVDEMDRLQYELPINNKDFAHLKILNVTSICQHLVLNKDTLAMGMEFRVPFTLEHEPYKCKKETKVYLSISYCPFCGKTVGNGGE